MIGPTCGDALGALWAAAVQQHHVRVLGTNLVELGPDEPMIVEVEPAGERDLRASREKDFVLGALPGGEEVTAVDHRRGQARKSTRLNSSNSLASRLPSSA